MWLSPRWRLKMGSSFGLSFWAGKKFYLGKFKFHLIKFLVFLDGIPHVFQECINAWGCQTQIEFRKEGSDSRPQQGL